MVGNGNADALAGFVVASNLDVTAALVDLDEAEPFEYA